MNRSEELDALMQRYPSFSPVLLLKICLTVYGAVLTERALERIQQQDLRFAKGDPYGLNLDIRKKDYYLPGPALFRDGSSLFINYGEPYDDPFTIDYDPASGEFPVRYRGETMDVIGFVPRPAFFDGVTRSGRPMDTIGGTGTSSRLLFNATQRCRFWEERTQCHYCALFTAGRFIREVDAEDARETVRAALQEPGRFTEICVSGGSDFAGDPPFSEELERYIRFMQALGSGMQEPIPLQLMAPAYPKAWLQRLRSETGMQSYRSNIEIWDAESFRRLCPGKEKWIGREAWMSRLCDAVDVFGKGKVYSNIVCGAELAGPEGFRDPEEAFESNMECCEYMTEHGIYSQSAIWRPHKREVLGWQPMQKPEYFVRIAQGFHDIRQKGFGASDGSWTRAGDMPDGDLVRADHAEHIPVANRVSHYAFAETDFWPQPLSAEVRNLLENGNHSVSALLQDESPVREAEESCLRLPELYAAPDGRILLPLHSDRDVLFAWLTKKIWFRSPLRLAVRTGAGTVQLIMRVHRMHVVGPVFAGMLQRIRAKEPDRELAAVCELHYCS